MYQIPPVTCILRPRRSGKTMALRMLKSFYCVSRNIDDNCLDSSKYPDLKTTDKDPFEGTFIYDESCRTKFFADTKIEEDHDFVKNNKGKWPVILLDFQNAKFSKSSSITDDEITKRITEEVIMPAFEQYDYLLFHLMCQHACGIEYGKKSGKTEEDLVIDYNLKKFKLMRHKIDSLWRYFKEELSDDIQKFYQYYSGKITTVEELNRALPFLMNALNRTYERQVIVLVDEHDGPVQSMHKGISFDGSRDNSELMSSINLLAERISDVLGKMAKSNDNLYRFLMFGISNAVTSRIDSGFNNLIKFDVFNTKWSQYFALSEDEIIDIVDRAFEKLKKKLKEKILKNIKDWYDGYHFEKGEKLYSIFSTFQYLGKCIQAYQKSEEEQKID
jgi:hypothetical protein